ncbi:WD repeat-containing protein 6, partial [Coemansia sp. IMI 209127]
MVSSDSLTVVWSVVDSVAGTCTKKAELVLPPGCQLASAAVDRERGWAVVGSANGGLYLFDLRDPASGAASAAAAAGTAQDVCGVPAIDPCVCWARAHGKHRLSSVAFASDSSFSLCGRASSVRSCVVLTGGRDGLVQQFAVHIGNEDYSAMPEEQRPLPKAVQSARSLDGLHQKIVLTRIRSDRVTRGWVEQLIWTTVPQRRLVAVTFHGKRLVALDLGITQSDASQPLHAPVVLLSLVCAGGSKPWQLLHTPQGVRVGVVMRSQLRTHTFASASSACTRVLVPGGCATESRCVAVVRIGGGAVVVATGGDDGCVRLFHSINSIDRMEQQQQLIGAVQCHTSAIRCMRASGAYLFTGGSKCELRSWTVVGQPPLLVEHARAPPPLLIANGARVMDICVVHAEAANAVIHVAAAYSDASIRLWRLDTKRKRFVCVAYDAAHTHCALSLASFCCSGDEGQPPLAAWWLVSGATNGQLAFWN